MNAPSAQRLCQIGPAPPRTPQTSAGIGFASSGSTLRRRSGLAFCNARSTICRHCVGLTSVIHAVGCFLDASVRCGRRYPVPAHAVAGAASRRLHCAARPGVASPNSLRSLRSLRSDSGAESDIEARAARAPTPALRCSSPQKSPAPGTACREAHPRWRAGRTPSRCLQRRERPGRRGHQEASAEQRSAAGSGRLRPKSACLRSCTQGRVCRLALRSEQRRAPLAQRGARLQPSPPWPRPPLPIRTPGSM